MGDIADWMIDQALDAEYYGHPSGAGYNRKRRNSKPYTPPRSGITDIGFILRGNYWVDQHERKLYPTKPPHAGGMTLAHIQAVKAYLIREFGESRVEGTTLWDALNEGERMHEGDLRKTKNLNEGVIQW